MTYILDYYQLLNYLLVVLRRYKVIAVQQQLSNEHDRKYLCFKAQCTRENYTVKYLNRAQQ